ncbi:MAG TPA: 4'-phosphopantetheinyl transferase superfamily protein [Terrimicrobiaceae bacterium]|nr:4'-phosphopantetheinyl transferase superfamily protein [Terrimicrobiaceae bacterium]
MSPCEPPAHGVRLLSVALDQSPDVIWGLRRLLSGDELRRADAFHFETDRQRWTAARAALRIALGHWTGTPPESVAITTDSHGKPHLAHPAAIVHFNLSHSGGQALIVLADEGPVGVDIEPMMRGKDLIDCAAAFLSPAELHQTAAMADHEIRAAHLLKIWCAKEAYLKAHGTGLSRSPDTLTLEAETGGCGKIHECGNVGKFTIHFPRPGIPGNCLAAVALLPGQLCPDARSLILQNACPPEMIDRA